MSQNKRNVDQPELDFGPAPDGNQHATGESTKDRRHVEAGHAAKDNKALGTAGRKAGYGKGNTRPEGQRE